MKSLLIALLALTGAAVYLGTQSNGLQATADIELYQKFQAWKAEHNKNYNSVDEMYRFAVFSQNNELIQKFNAEQTGSLRLGLNRFADLTNDEFRQIYVGGGLQEQSNTEQQSLRNIDITNAPDTLNWTDKGAVNPVEDQGQCGSCWAFSTKEALEGAYYFQNGSLEVFSAQQLVDCDHSSYGCQGGYQQSTWTYTQESGITTNSAYPYVSGTTGRATQCQYTSGGYKNAGSVMVSPRNNQDAIVEAVQGRPLSILIEADSFVFQLYNSGVLNSASCGTRTDHAVLLTGYNQSSSAETPYWIVKNSWGKSWGNQGYVWIAMTGDGAGMCGINTSVGYPTY